MPQGGGTERGERQSNFSTATACLLIIIGMMTATGCQTRLVSLVPPSEIHSLEGEGSFYLSGPDGTFRFRLGFYSRLPDEARLELFDPFGRLRTVVWLRGDLATLYLPAERVYWQGEGRVLMAEVFGYELKTIELFRILAGLWARLAEEAGWQLRLDSRGQVLEGEKDGLSFVLKESFAPGLIPRTVYFFSGNYRVRLRVLSLHFNRNQNAQLFNPTLPAGVKRLEWEEVSGRWKK